MISQGDRPDDSDRIAQAYECDREQRCAEAQSSKVKSKKFLEVQGDLWNEHLFDGTILISFAIATHRLYKS
jgi:hypothetical protein